MKEAQKLDSNIYMSTALNNFKTLKSAPPALPWHSLHALLICILTCILTWLLCILPCVQGRDASSLRQSEVTAREREREERRREERGEKEREGEDTEKREKSERKRRERRERRRGRERERDLLGNNVHDGGVQGAAR